MNAIKLPFHFDVEALRKEIDTLPDSGYYYLYNPYLEPDSLAGFHFIEPEVEDGLPVFKPNQHLAQRPALLNVLNTFQCDKETFRVHNLKAGFSIRRHRDIARNFENNIIRVHIPINTHDEVYTYLDDERVKMEEGECWYMDLDLYHEIHNKGEGDRVNLVMDCLRNEWWEEIFASLGKEHKESTYYHMTVDELKQMKEMMAGIDGAAGGTIIKEIEEELASRT